MSAEKERLFSGSRNESYQGEETYEAANLWGVVGAISGAVLGVVAAKLLSGDADHISAFALIVTVPTGFVVGLYLGAALGILHRERGEPIISDPPKASGHSYQSLEP